MTAGRFFPNLITFAGLFSGFVGIVHLIYGNMLVAGSMIFLAAFFDLFDGKVARAMQSESTTGHHLDGLIDMVNFGVLPGLLLHFLLIKTHSNWIQSLYLGDASLVALMAFVLPMGTAYRLAKFSSSEEKEPFFRGLPSPAAGILIGSLPLIMRYDLLLINYQTIYLTELVLNPTFLLIITLAVPLLMVSNIPMFKLTFNKNVWKKNQTTPVFLVISLILFVLLFFTAIPLIILIYILMSIILKKQFQ